MIPIFSLIGRKFCVMWLEKSKSPPANCVMVIFIPLRISKLLKSLIFLSGPQFPKTTSFQFFLVWILVLSGFYHAKRIDLSSQQCWRTLRTCPFSISLRFLGAFAKLLLLAPSFCPSIHLSVWNNSVPTERISMKCLYLRIFVKPVEKIQVAFKPDKNNGQFAWKPVCIYDDMLLSAS